MKTQIEDIIVPEVFNPYVKERTAELSALFQSGIISSDAELTSLAEKGGRLINMPFFNDLTGDDEVLSDSGALTPGKITTRQDIACLIMRGRAWAANDLAGALAGADPLKAIGDLVATYWGRRMQAILLAELTGVFAATSMSGNVHDISGEAGDAAVISASTFIDALQKLGDSKDKLTAVAMHSATVSKLAKDDLIQTIPDTDGKPKIKTFLSKRIIEDDSMPFAAGVYTTYLFGEGAVGYGDGKPPVPVETDRDSLGGDDYLINRKHFLLHPRGIKFTDSSVDGSSPDNAELETAANWLRVYENKNIRIVKFVHKLA